MAKRGKKYTESKGKFDLNQRYSLEEALEKLPQVAFAKFDESVDVAVRLGVDPKRADQMVRGTVALPHGTGKDVRVAVFAKGEKEKEAQEAGADVVGGEDLAKKIADEGWLEFDKAVATPDMMSVVGKIARILGPRGLMPNPKVGTVTFDIKKTVAELKAGKTEFRVDKVGNIHVSIGRISFDAGKAQARTCCRSARRPHPRQAVGQQGHLSPEYRRVHHNESGAEDRSCEHPHIAEIRQHDFT